MFRSTAVLVIVAFAAYVLAQKPIDQVFTVNFDSDDLGGCHTRRHQLEQMWQDVWQLVNAGVSMIQDAEAGDVSAKRALDGYFHDRQPDDTAHIAQWYQGVKDFVENGVLAVNPNGHPNFFCSDSWLTQETWDSPAHDINNNLLKQTIREAEPDFYSREGSKRGISPYYSPVHRDYLPDIKRVNKGRLVGYCFDADAVAATQDTLGDGSITMCPQAFLDKDLNGRHVDLVIGTTNPRCENRPTSKRYKSDPNQPEKQNIRDVSCTALTLYHELFHLTWGNEDSPDYTTKSGQGLGYELRWIIGTSDIAEKIKNPETYALAALAYWYTKNKRDPRQPDRVVGYECGLCWFQDSPS